MNVGQQRHIFMLLEINQTKMRRILAHKLER